MGRRWPAQYARRFPRAGVTLDVLSRCEASPYGSWRLAGTRIAFHSAEMQATRINSGRSPGHHDRSGLRGARWSAKLGVTGLSVAILVQVAGLCPCIPGGAPPACGTNECCPAGTVAHGSSDEAPLAASVVTGASQCCPQSMSARVLRAEPREPAAAVWAGPAAASLGLAGLPVAMIVAVAPRPSASSPPRSPVLRI